MSTTVLTSSNDAVDLISGFQIDFGTGYTSAGGISLDGADGHDLLVIQASLADFSLARSPTGTLWVSTAEGTASFTNFERLIVSGQFLLHLGTSAADTIFGTDGADTLLYGLGGNDRLDGKAGADEMRGNDGDDFYFVDNTGDKAIELSGEGSDTVLSSVSYTLGSSVENLSLDGTLAINATGNDLANGILGNGASNILNGGIGADSMYGKNGNDTYYVDNAGDLVADLYNEGNDTIIASVSYSLADTAGGNNVDANYIETLKLSGSTHINATGNTRANTLIGNNGNNLIDGGAGADSLRGGYGNDTYVVTSGDLVIELAGQGIDKMVSATSATLAANVENLQLTGIAAANAIGNTANNIISGNAAANVIRGGLGSDTMTGATGRDTFDFDAAAHSVTGSASRDIITDFAHMTDRIDLSTIDASTKYSGNNTFTLLAKSGALFTGKGAEVRFTSGSTTVIEGDINGDKRADFQIQLSGYVPLSSSDFLL